MCTDLIRTFKLRSEHNRWQFADIFMCDFSLFQCKFYWILFKGSWQCLLCLDYGIEYLTSCIFVQCYLPLSHLSHMIIPTSWCDMTTTWWRHQMATFSALLALCVGNSPVTGEFPSQTPVMWSFDVFFDLHLNKWSSIQSWGWWFETPSRSLWRHFKESTSFWIQDIIKQERITYLLKIPEKKLDISDDTLKKRRWIKSK